MVIDVGVPVDGDTTVTVPRTSKFTWVPACATGLAIATAEDAKTLATLSATTAPYLKTLWVLELIAPRFVWVYLNNPRLGTKILKRLLTALQVRSHTDSSLQEPCETCQRSLRCCRRTGSRRIARTRVPWLKCWIRRAGRTKVRIRCDTTGVRIRGCGDARTCGSQFNDERSQC